MRTLLLLTLLILSSCSSNEIQENNLQRDVDQIVSVRGFIISSELFNDRYFTQNPYYLIPAKLGDEEGNIRGLHSKVIGDGIQFNLYQPYYVKLINCMSYDIYTYRIDDSKPDNSPRRMMFETRRILPVEIKYIIKDISQISDRVDTFKIDIGESNVVELKARFVGEIKIQDLKILVAKEATSMGDLNMKNPFIINKTR